MWAFFTQVLSSDFMPHGHCYLWLPEILWLHVGSDALTGLSYFIIPSAFVYFLKKRPDIEFHWVFPMFALFILACGTTHVMNIVTTWHAAYRLEGVIKLLTGIISIATAVVLWRLMPQLITLPSPAQLRDSNERALEEMQRRLEAEQNRHKADSLLEATAEMAQVGGWELDIETMTVVWSKQVYQIHEIPLGTPIELESAINYYAPEAKPIIESAVQKALDEGEAWDLELPLVTAKGNPRWVRAMGKVESVDGKVVRLFGVLQDISAHKAAEEELILAERSRTASALRFQAVFEGAGIGIAIVDSEGRPNQTNEKLQQFLGFSGEELQGMYLRDITYPEDVENDELLAQELFAGDRERYHVEKRYYCKGGRMVWANVYASIIDEGESEIRWGIKMIEDITDRKQYEEQLKQSNAELEQFAYVASHDLQEPLRVVSSFLQLLERRYGDVLDDKALHFVHQAVSGAERMKTLTNDLLALSRVSTRARSSKVISCDLVLEEVLKNLRIALEEAGGQVVVDPLPMVQADPTQLSMLFQNLVGNAIKFRGEKSPNIRIDAARKDEYWCFAVRDNGIGIAPEFAERVFVIFQRLHVQSEYSGTGIGLAICKRIVERHGGNIWFESEPGQGSTFYFTLPYVEEVSAVDASDT